MIFNNITDLVQLLLYALLLVCSIELLIVGINLNFPANWNNIERRRKLFSIRDKLLVADMVLLIVAVALLIIRVGAKCFAR